MHSLGYAPYSGDGADGDIWFEVDGYPPTEGMALIDYGDGTSGLYEKNTSGYW